VAPPNLPAVGEVVRDAALVLDATTTPFALTYRHRNPNAKRHGPVTDWVGYNGGGTAFADADERPPGHPVHDFMVECEVEVAGGGQGVFSVQLGDGADEVGVHLPIQAGAGAAAIAHGGSHHPFDAPFALVPGKRYKLEVAFFDRRVLVAIDGRQAAAPLDLPPAGATARQPREEVRGEPLSRWAGVTRPVRVQCRGGHVVVREFTLWRDIHYREGSGKHGVKGECPLGANEYFLLGDNTASSFDSREWDTPGVPERDFLGKPFLVHQPLKAATVPVFGRVQAIDWGRFRLLR
jgi:signal peptidase I